MVLDPVGDYLIRIKNAVACKHDDVMIPYSKLKEAISKILLDCRLIAAYQVVGNVPKKHIKIDLKYQSSKSCISDLKRISKPGRRVYVGHEEIPRIQRGFGVAVLSTPKGVLSDKDAREQHLGGELLLAIW